MTSSVEGIAGVLGMLTVVACFTLDELLRIWLEGRLEDGEEAAVR